VSDPNPRRRSGRGVARPSPASLGLIRVGAGFSAEFPGADVSSTEAYASMARTGTALLQELDRCILDSFEMPHAAATALAVLEGADEPLTPSQISERMLVASATMTATLDLLEDRGWVIRRPNAVDRRSVLVEVTDAGRAAADRLLPGIRVVEREVMSALTARERQQLLVLLEKVLKRAAEIAEAPPIPLDGPRKRPPRPSRP
jgi:DNA-binding MarR family transcriptional regulator